MRALCLAAAAALSAWAAPAGAAVLYESGEPTQQWTTITTQIEGAARLVFAADTTITDLEGWFVVVASDSGATYKAVLYADGVDGLRPGAQLSSVVVAGQNVGFAGWDGAHGLSWNVNAGSYWLGFQGNGVDLNDDSYHAQWWGGAPSPVTRYSVNLHNGVGWQRQPGAGLAFRINGEGGPAMAGEPFPPKVVVPEPTTWAMMIMGFGLAGAALRRRSVPA